MGELFKSRFVNLHLTHILEHPTQNDDNRHHQGLHLASVAALFIMARVGTQPHFGLMGKKHNETAINKTSAVQRDKIFTLGGGGHFGAELFPVFPPESETTLSLLTPGSELKLEREGWSCNSLVCNDADDDVLGDKFFGTWNNFATN